MAKARGYTKNLLVLPFDHRGSFQEKMFGVHGTPTPDQTKLISSYKTMIFEGFEKALAGGLPKDQMGILVDEQFGAEVIARTKKLGVTLCVPAEKSGQEEFDFEHGKHFAEAIDKVDPNFVKVLVRYNPEGDEAMNHRQAARLAELGNFLAKTNRYYMFELLVPATAEQLKRSQGDKGVYDREFRPRLMIQAIQELQKAGVEPDVWKIEGLDRKEDFDKVAEATRAGGRDQVACIVLGRGENEEKVKHWLSVGAQVKGVVGFAVGRTVFWEPLMGFKEKKYSREEAISRVARNYTELCQLWMREKAR